MQELNAPKLWVVFTDHTDLPWLRILKRGFRHCFVLMHDGQRWTSFDPLASHIDIGSYHEIPSDFDFTAHMKLAGNTVLEVPQGPYFQKLAPPGFFTCVEFVKRLAGIHAFFIITPWQLYRHIQKQIEQQKET